MFHDLLSSRLIQAGLAFFVLVVGGSLLYSWHVQRTTDAELGPIPLALESLENKPETNTAPVDFQTEGVTNTPDANTDTPMSETTEALPNDDVDLAEAFLPDDFVSEEETPAEEVPVSPYGFGPYPELPEGWSPNTFPTATPEHELLARVRIKLISQGINTEGAAYEENNLIYPIVKGTVYVEWDYSEFPNGTRKYISEISGHPADVRRIMALQEEARRGKKSFSESQVPSDIKLILFTEAGINPYEFLNLK